MTGNTRRVMLKQSLTAAVALVTGEAAQPRWAHASAVPSLAETPIVDTHQHLWDLQLFKPPWLVGAPVVLRQKHTMQDYLQATAGLNVIKAVYMEIDVDPSQQEQEAAYVIDLCRTGRHPTVAAVISGRPAAPEFDKYISRFADSPYVKGVRQVLHAKSTPPGYCLDPQFIRGIRRLGELNLSFDLCLRAADLADGVKLTALCPDTRFIVDHCGNADPKAFDPTALSSDTPATHDAQAWRRDMDALAARPNVVCKISGIVAQAPAGWTADILAPVINHCLDHFGPDRVMFGSDWPVCRLRASYRQWVEALWHIVTPRSASERQRLFHDNAIKFYALA